MDGRIQEGIVLFGLMSFMLACIYMRGACDYEVGKESVGMYMYYFVAMVGAEVIYVSICATC